MWKDARLGIVQKTKVPHLLTYVHLNSYSILQPFYTLLQLALSMETWDLYRSPVVLAVPRYHETRRCCSVVHTVSSANLQYKM
jgi:hypothetical protein